MFYPTYAHTHICTYIRFIYHSECMLVTIPCSAFGLTHNVQGIAYDANTQLRHIMTDLRSMVVRSGDGKRCSGYPAIFCNVTCSSNDAALDGDGGDIVLCQSSHCPFRRSVGVQSPWRRSLRVSMHIDVVYSYGKLSVVRCILARFSNEYYQSWSDAQSYLWLDNLHKQ